MRSLFILAMAAMVPLHANDRIAESALNKLDLIESGRAKPGSVIVFTPAEINAWAEDRVPAMYQGIREPRVQLGNGSAVGSAMVDFLKMRQGQGLTTNSLLSRFIEGERPLKVSVRLESAGGRATAYLTRLELSGAAVTGAALDFLVNQFFLHLFPDAKVNRPFDLPDNIERLEIRQDGVRVTIRK
jgi:hypothetical protein